MQKIPRHIAAIGFAVLALPGVSSAQQFVTGPDGVATSIIVPAQSLIYDQNSLSLPAPPVVHGQDIIRGADGTSCQSAIGSGGPYVDMSVIGSQDVFNRETASGYGRVIVPLGKRGKRPAVCKPHQCF